MIDNHETHEKNRNQKPIELLKDASLNVVCAFPKMKNSNLTWHIESKGKDSNCEQSVGADT